MPRTKITKEEADCFTGKKQLMKSVKRKLVEAIACESDEEVIGLYEYWIAEGNSFSG